MAIPRLKEKYQKEIVPALKDKFQYKSIMQVPKLKKISVNKGIGIAVSDKKLVDVGVEELTQITERGFDGRGNYTLGVQEQIIFPEISLENVTRISGMDITFVTSAETDEESLALLKAFGLPFTSSKN